MKFFRLVRKSFSSLPRQKNIYASADSAELAWNEKIIANYCKDVKQVSGTEPVPGRKNLIRRHLLLPCGVCGRAGRNFRLNAVSMPNGSDFLRDAVGTDGDSVRTEEKVNGALHGRNGV